MSRDADRLRLRQALEACQRHRDALADALVDIDARTWNVDDIDADDKAARRLLDQFAFRFIRLQDAVGGRLMPAVLAVLGEEPSSMAVLDRLNRLEQLGWLESADDWGELRRIRNEFSHDYPEQPEQRFARWQLAVRAARRTVAVFEHLRDLLRQRQGGNGPQ